MTTGDWIKETGEGLARAGAGYEGLSLELHVRIGCRGKKAEAVLHELGQVLAEGEARSMNPLIVLEELGLLADSIMTLMRGISTCVAGTSRTVTFWESSGYREAFLSAMEAKADHFPKAGGTIS